MQPQIAEDAPAGVSGARLGGTGDDRVRKPGHASIVWTGGHPAHPPKRGEKHRTDTLIESAQDRWRAVNAPHLVAVARAGPTFINGKLVERPGEDAQPEAA